MRGSLSKRGNRTNLDTVGRPDLSGRERTDERDLSPAAPALMRPASLSRMLSRNWKLIAGITAAVTVLAWIISAMQPTQYRASALAAVAPLSESLQANEVLRGVEVLERRTVVATIAALASTAATRTQAAAGEGYEIEAVVLPNTNLFRVDVQGGDRTAAAAVANRIPGILSAQTQAMYKYYGVTMVSPAATPTSAFLPRTGRAIATGLLIGLFLGLLAAYAMEWRRGPGIVS